MNRRLLALVALLVGCTSAPLATPQLEAVRDPILASTAPGDTLRYTLRLASPVTGAANYLWTTTATPAGWSGMLTSASTTTTSIAFTPINATTWDSVRFTACVVATRPGKTSAPGCVTWPLTRLGTPGIPTVDSSLVIASIILLPDAATLAGGQQLQFCPYAKALDGKVRFISGYHILPECQFFYDAMPDSVRLPGYPVAMSLTPQTWLMDGGPDGGLFVAVRTPQQELAAMIFAPIYRVVRT